MAIRMSGMMSGLDTESIIKELMKAQSSKKTKIENSKTKLEWKQEKWKDLNSKIYGLYTGTLSKLKLQSTYNTKKIVSSNEGIVSATATAGACEGTNVVEVKELASSQYITGEKISTTTNGKVESTTKLSDIIGSTADIKDKAITVKLGDGKETNIELTEEMTVSDFTKALKDAGINANFDTKQQRFFLSATDTGMETAFEITEQSVSVSDGTKTYSSVGESANIMKKLGMGEVKKDTTGYTFTGNNNNFIKAANAKIEVNGVEFTDTSNNVEVNGITYKLNSAQVGTKVRIEVTKDTSAVYDTVKAFINEYNEVLKAMNTAYNAETAKGYEPLTDEEKDAMSEEQVKKWENKIKDSLLRRDSTLDSLISTMKNSLVGSVTVGDKKYSLATLGISTSSDYTEKGLLHIHGDSEDTTYSADDNKLKTMIENDPETVMEVLTELGKNLYDNLNDKMKSSNLSSALTFYNDKQMKTQMNTYETQIKDWEKRLTTMEDRYYKKFTAMETALSKLESQSSYISGMFSSQ